MRVNFSLGYARGKAKRPGSSSAERAGSGSASSSPGASPVAKASQPPTTGAASSPGASVGEPRAPPALKLASHYGGGGVANADAARVARDVRSVFRAQGVEQLPLTVVAAEVKWQTVYLPQLGPMFPFLRTHPAYFVVTGTATSGHTLALKPNRVMPPMSPASIAAAQAHAEAAASRRKARNSGPGAGGDGARAGQQATSSQAPSSVGAGAGAGAGAGSAAGVGPGAGAGTTTDGSAKHGTAPPAVSTTKTGSGPSSTSIAAPSTSIAAPSGLDFERRAVVAGVEAMLRKSTSPFMAVLDLEQVAAWRMSGQSLGGQLGPVLAAHRDKFKVELDEEEDRATRVWLLRRYVDARNAARMATLNTGEAAPGGRASGEQPAPSRTRRGRRGSRGRQRSSSSLQGVPADLSTSPTDPAPSGPSSGELSDDSPDLRRTRLCARIRDVLLAARGHVSLVSVLGHVLEWRQYRQEFGGLKAFLDAQHMFRVDQRKGEHVVSLARKSSVLMGKSPRSASGSAASGAEAGAGAGPDSGAHSPSAGQAATEQGEGGGAGGQLTAAARRRAAAEAAKQRAAGEAGTEAGVTALLESLVLASPPSGVHLAHLGNVARWAEHRNRFGNLRAFLSKHSDLFTLQRTPDGSSITVWHKYDVARRTRANAACGAGQARSPHQRAIDAVSKALRTHAASGAGFMLLADVGSVVNWSTHKPACGPLLAFLKHNPDVFYVQHEDAHHVGARKVCLQADKAQVMSGAEAAADAGVTAAGAAGRAGASGAATASRDGTEAGVGGGAGVGGEAQPGGAREGARDAKPAVAVLPAISRQVCCKIMDVLSQSSNGTMLVNLVGTSLHWNEFKSTCGPLLSFLRQHSYLFRVTERKPGAQIVTMAPARGGDPQAKRRAFLCDLLDDTIREMGGRAMVHDLAPRLRWHLFEHEFGTLATFAEHARPRFINSSVGRLKFISLHPLALAGSGGVQRSPPVRASLPQPPIVPVLPTGNPLGRSGSDTWAYPPPPAPAGIGGVDQRSSRSYYQWQSISPNALFRSARAAVGSSVQRSASASQVGRPGTGQHVNAARTAYSLFPSFPASSGHASTSAAAHQGPPSAPSLSDVHETAPSGALPKPPVSSWSFSQLSREPAPSGLSRAPSSRALGRPTFAKPPGSGRGFAARGSAPAGAPPGFEDLGGSSASSAAESEPTWSGPPGLAVGGTRLQASDLVALPT